jgi:hypothetical protein
MKQHHFHLGIVDTPFKYIHRSGNVALLFVMLLESCNIDHGLSNTSAAVDGRLLALQENAP